MADVDARLQVKISDNRMRTLVNYTPPSNDGQRLTRQLVMDQLAEANVIHGIRTDAITLVIESDRPMNSVVVAEGEPPEQGEKARIEMYVKIHEYRAMEREDGSVDFYNLGDICTASEGQELYRRIPPTVGKPGRDVLGREIPGLPGRDLKIMLGPGTRIDEQDENLVRATVSGEVMIQNGKLQISEVHHIPRDVDFSTGNIKFNGMVKIGGTVKAGFSVVAGSSIEIGGNVEDATVIAGNDIVINGGFVGNGDGKAVAGRDVFVKFIENQRIEADRDVIISGESYHATISAGRTIHAKGRKGAIIGGTCIAKKQIEADYFGSKACPPTIIKIGVDPKLNEKMKRIEEELGTAKNSFEQVEKSMVYLYRLKIDNNDVLPPQKQELLTKLEKAKTALPQKIKDLEQNRDALIQSQKEISDAEAVAHVGVFPKVQIHIGNQWVLNDEELGASRYRFIESDIVRLSK